MSDPPKAGSSNGDDAQPGSSGSARGGFYSNFRANKNATTAVETPSKPSFMDHSTINSTPVPVKPNDSKSSESMLNSTTRLSSTSFRSSVAKSSSTPALPVASFGTLKRKRPADVVEKPTGFKVSEFVNKEMATPRLPSFGTSLTKAKFDFTSNRSMFYSGTTKFGGSSSLREESAKRIKISPVSKHVRTNLTKVSAAKPYSNDHRTLSSKTAESILKTLNKIVMPTSSEQQQQREHSRRAEYMPNFSTLSKRLREKKKHEISLPPPPVERLNKIESVQVTRPPVQTTTKEPTPPPPSNDTEVEEVVPPVTAISSVLTAPSIPTPAPVVAAPVVEAVSKAAGKEGLKMKRQRTTQHYSAASDKDEEPVNTMPEVRPIEPMIITAMPKFDMTVTPATKPAVSSSKPSILAMEPLTPAVKSIPEVTPKVIEKPPAPMFTPIMKPTKTKLTSGVDDKTGSGFQFSSPKLISEKNIECNAMDTSYSFISPVTVVNSDTSFLAPTKKPSIEAVKPCVLTPVKEVEVDKTPVEKPKAAAAPFSFKFSKPADETKPAPSDSENTAAAKPFTFGTPSAAIAARTGSTVPAAVEKETSGFTFSKPPTAVASSGFSFGKDSNDSEPKVTATVPAFSFGTPAAKKTEEPVVENETAEPVIKPAASIPVTKPNPFAALSKPSAGTWDCEVCDVPNKSDSLECVACATPKPGAEKAPEAVKASPFMFGTTDNSASSGGFSFGPASTATSGFSFGKPAAEKTDGFSFGKKSEEHVPSEEPKSESAPAPAAPTFGSAPASGGFSFGTTAKPAEQGSFQAAAAKANPFMKKAQPAGWECPTCMVNNKDDDLKCVACTEAKPGSQPSEAAPAASANSGFSFGVSEGAKSTFSFGAKEAKSDFSFGVKTDAKPAFSFGAKEDTKAPAFSFGAKEESKAPAFSFGAKEEPKPSDSSLASNPLTNGGSSTFSFVPPAAEKSASTDSVASGFSFVPSVPSLQSAPSSDFSFGKPAATTASTGFSFGSASTTAASSGFSFGAPPATNGPSEAKSMPSIFGSLAPPAQTNGPSTEKAPAPAGFTFGAASKPDAGAGFSFGGLNAAASAPSNDTNVFAGAPAFDASKFNGTAASAAPTPAAPAFNFNAASSNGPSFMFSSNDAKPTASGAPPPSNFSTTPSFNFGAPTNAGAVFGNPTPGGFNFANNNNDVGKTDNATNNSIFAQPPAAGANLFTIGGGGSANPPANNVTASGRKIKRAHRKLGGQRR